MFKGEFKEEQLTWRSLGVKFVKTNIVSKNNIYKNNFDKLYLFLYFYLHFMLPTVIIVYASIIYCHMYILIYCYILFILFIYSCFFHRLITSCKILLYVIFFRFFVVSKLNYVVKVLSNNIICVRSTCF